MASMDPVALLSEAEFGCEHLAAVLSQNQETAGPFKASFMKINHVLAPRGSSVRDFSKRKTPSTLLKPKYTCLTCSESFVNGERKAHLEKTGHMFYMESRNRILFCQNCSDFVYDSSLERLRSSPPKDLAKGRKRLSNEYSADDELYIRTNANKRPCARQGVRGLFNLGQTCYMNAILQTLLHDPLINNYFLGNGHHPHECSPYECLGCAFTDAVADFNNYEKPEGFPALAVLMASWKQIPSMAGYYQHDAHEWYQFLIDRLHACTEGHLDNNERSCPCFFHKTFYGKLRSSVTCDKCGNVTRKDEPMIDLSLDVQIQAKKRAMGGIGSAGTPTLNGCLESFTSQEKLMADAYNCNGCGGTPQKATKQMQIKKLPAILCMQLKRFEHKSKASSKSSFSDKIEGRIDFPLSVNMLPYTTNPNSQRVDKSKYWYDLSSAVIHKGKLESGHYYAYCRQGDQWFLFNDDQVTSVSEAEVLNADAYLLFYHLRALSYSPY